jgi:1,4-alpha-glucan branching enzyme
MIRKKYSRDAGHCTVEFVVQPEQASGHVSFMLVGDFNNWDKTATALRQHKDGSFAITLTLNAGREYHFRYFVDGDHWENDWQADKYVHNPYGSAENSVAII